MGIEKIWPQKPNFFLVFPRYNNEIFPFAIKFTAIETGPILIAHKLALGSSRMPLT
jgi:hypothetical protein